MSKRLDELNTKYEELSLKFQSTIDEVYISCSKRSSLFCSFFGCWERL